MTTAAAPIVSTPQKFCTHCNLFRAAEGGRMVRNGYNRKVFRCAPCLDLQRKRAIT